VCGVDAFDVPAAWWSMAVVAAGLAMAARTRR
jgi:MYXO-CTERM domain-containing protein